MPEIDEKTERLRKVLGAGLGAYKDYCVTPLEGIDEPGEGAVETCRAAVAAIADAFRDHLRTGEPEHGRFIKFAGAIIEYPDGVDVIMDDPELSGEEQIKEIERTGWAETTARGLCEGEQIEIDACTERLKHDLACAALYQRLKWYKKE